MVGLLGSARGDRRRRSTPAEREPTASSGSTPATAATIDDEHYLTISDRKKDVIISGGENVSSIEVEDAIFSHPDVAEVAVIGVPDEKWGELVMALVVRTPGRIRHRGRTDRLHAGPSSPGTSARSGSSSATSWPAPPPASCRSSSCASRTGPGGPSRSTDASEDLTEQPHRCPNVDGETTLGELTIPATNAHRMGHEDL